MINILSINCGLAFAPYLAQSFSAFLHNGAPVSQVIRQGGSGLIIRSDAAVNLRYRNRESVIGAEQARHYYATIQFRSEYFDVARTSDEIVFANFGRSLLLSHPQSELWLAVETISQLLAKCSGAVESPSGLPDWLSISTGGGRLLLSDQRSARWVLLGSDHIAELKRRAELLKGSNELPRTFAPPTIPLKGVTIHLQSAIRLAEALEAFSAKSEVTAYEEVAPTFHLRLGRATEGIEVSDSNGRVALTAREARKWAEIMRSELARLDVRQVEGARIRTVIANGERGRWVLQWGDEVFVPDDLLRKPSSLQTGETADAQGKLAIKRTEEFLLFMRPFNGGCVALTHTEAQSLAE